MKLVTITIFIPTVYCKFVSFQIGFAQKSLDNQELYVNLPLPSNPEITNFVLIRFICNVVWEFDYYYKDFFSFSHLGNGSLAELTNGWSTLYNTKKDIWEPFKADVV